MELYLVQGSRLGERVARSFMSRLGNYAVSFVMGVVGGYMAKSVGDIIAKKLNIGDIGDWGITGLGLVALFLAGKFVVAGFVRVVWPFYLGLAIGAAMATGLLDKLKGMVENKNESEAGS